MAGSPKYKVYNDDGEYQASCKTADDAAVLLVIAHPRGSVRYQHGKLLLSGGELPSNVSYDEAAQLILAREAKMQQAAYDHAHAHLGAAHPSNR